MLRSEAQRFAGVFCQRVCWLNYCVVHGRKSNLHFPVIVAMLRCGGVPGEVPLWPPAPLSSYRQSHLLDRIYRGISSHKNFFEASYVHREALRTTESTSWHYILYMTTHTFVALYPFPSPRTYRIVQSPRASMIVPPFCPA